MKVLDRQDQIDVVVLPDGSALALHQKIALVEYSKEEIRKELRKRAMLHRRDL